MTIVTLTTDFGTADGYVGTMKGVILGIAPAARLVDLSHEIAPQNVRQAAYVLYTAVPFFPPGTIHLVVVDPGVGSQRRAIAVRTAAATFVGPDNGIFTLAMARAPVEAIVELCNPRYQLSPISHTFHGRDIFSPAAAHLATGVPLAELGPPVHDPVTFPLPRLSVGPEAIQGEVLHADRFGNVITSIGVLRWEKEELVFEGVEQRKDRGKARFRAGGAIVEVAGRELAGVRHTYAEAEMGEPLALVGSGGHLELAVRQGRAADLLGLRPGDPVTLRFELR